MAIGWVSVVLVHETNYHVVLYTHVQHYSCFLGIDVGEEGEQEAEVKHSAPN